MENYKGTVFGKLRIPLHIFHEGDWELKDVITQYNDSNLTTWNQERQQFLYDVDKDTRVPEDVRNYIRPLVEKRKKEAESRGAPFFDGQQVRFADWGVRVEDGDEETEIEKLIIRLAPTSWFTYNATNRSYDDNVLKDKDGVSISMRAKYGVNAVNLKDWMANSIGVSTTLISEPSGALIMVQRSEKLGQYPSLYGVAAAGFMDRIRDVVEDKPNPFKMMKRELEEEAGIECQLDDPKYGFRLLGIGRALDDLHGEFWGETMSQLTTEQIMSAPKKAKFEQLRMFALDFNPKEIIPYVVQRITEVPKGITSGRDAWIIGESPAWVPAHVYATIKSLIKHYGYKDVMEELERSLKG